MCGASDIQVNFVSIDNLLTKQTARAIQLLKQEMQKKFEKEI